MATASTTLTGTQQAKTFDDLVRAGTLLSEQTEFKALVSTLVEQGLDITRSDLACLYVYANPEARTDLRLIFRRGKYSAPAFLKADSDLLWFLHECGESVCLTERKKSPFADLLLDDKMNCGMAFPLSTPRGSLGVMVLNSLSPLFFNRERFNFLDSYTKLAAGMLQNAKMFQELKEYLAKIEEMEHYQESIFTSMTNLLVTTDKDGFIRYVNRAAKDTLSLDDTVMGKPLGDVFKKTIDNKIMKAISTTAKDGKELAGVEGIYEDKDREKEIDFSLNLSPLKGEGGKITGTTLLFTDQTREKNLATQMAGVTEDRRKIKDMFAKYLSEDLVSHLTENPESINLGGNALTSTVFFADIRGYTSFSEGHPPEYVIDVLNEYFTEAVEIVIKYGGYIDKYIGDCIMAAFGVPISNPEQDAINAVSCAVEIIQIVHSANRKFFQGKASHLKVGFGMHTGRLIAGNLGSARKMNYTVIGDTVNVAARLEGESEAGEIIITQDTRDYLGDLFTLDPRTPVKVKGKANPIPIYNVVGFAGKPPAAADKEIRAAPVSKKKKKK
ncbi:MAG: PAS domain-containing protein [Deltaproteobacteria bacterium]|nr:PAS domain-containing protein [Deltaproteobacteria bacterium]